MIEDFLEVPVYTCNECVWRGLPPFSKECRLDDFDYPEEELSWLCPVDKRHYKIIHNRFNYQE